MKPVKGASGGKLVNKTANAAPHLVQRRVLHIVFASTSGHTEYVVDALTDSLRSITPGWEIEATRAEKMKPLDLLSGDVLLLASSTWNTGSVEGQLNPHMWVLLHDDTAKTLDLAGKPCACIGLGDHRYLYTARAADHLERYVKVHHGRLIVPTLKITDEPYGQEESVRVWGKQLVDASTQIDRC
ncbi:flavodoxin I [Bradyrhizobium sp. AZCC 2262]|uniref:flavodoxin domain-containing protein n=1 Tax=Bradyrhizobium sp. AZCC 2262 TaxID=3117022 RepID=UPI002FF00317